MTDLKTSKNTTTKLSKSAYDKQKKGSLERDVFAQIALTAYYKAETRGYEPGHEIQDWLEAEAEVNR
jgi:hypothetical protein